MQWLKSYYSTFKGGLIAVNAGWLSTFLVKEKRAALRTPFSSLVGSVIWQIRKNQHTRITTSVCLFLLSATCSTHSIFKWPCALNTQTSEFGDYTLIICSIKDLSSPNFPVNSVFFLCMWSAQFLCHSLCFNEPAVVLNVCSEKGWTV